MPAGPHGGPRGGRLSTWLVSPPDHTDWRLDLDHLARALPARWRICSVVHDLANDTLDFEVDFENRRGHGTLHADRQFVILESSDILEAAELAARLRKLVPGRPTADPLGERTTTSSSRLSRA